MQQANDDPDQHWDRRLLVGYIALPPFRAFILERSPILFTLLCPLSMFFMMEGMAGRAHQEPPKDESLARIQTSATTDLVGYEWWRFWIDVTLITHEL